MRKLMIAAATAALAAGAFAGEPQAYEMTLTVKASVCATNKKAVKTDCGEITAYRKQTTRKYKGIFWGCDCGVIACPTSYYSGEHTDYTGLREYLFWSETKGFTYPLYSNGSAGFQWTILQVVGQKAANVEGMWTLALDSEDGTQLLNVSGAGYGTAQSACTETAKIKSMSGYLIGEDAAFNGSVGCLYCAEGCDAHEFCTADVCSSLIGPNNEAVLFGTWSLKFNSSIAKKLLQGKTIKEAYKFPKYVSEKLDAIAAITNGETEQDKEDAQKQEEAKKVQALKQAYDEAKTAYETAQKAFVDAQASITELQTTAETIASLTAETPTGTTQGLALATAFKNAQAADTAADNKIGDATKGATKAVADAKTVLDATMNDKGAYSAIVAAYMVDANNLALAKRQLTIDQAGVIPDDFATPNLKTAAIDADKQAIQAAQVALNATKKAYDDAYAGLSDVAKTDSDAYKTALQTLHDAQIEKLDALRAIARATAAITTWVTGAEGVQGAKATALRDARASLQTLQADANSKAQIVSTYCAQVINAGGTCE